MRTIACVLWVYLLFVTGCEGNRPLQATGPGFRIAANHDPDSLDPRLARDLASASIVHMLFEGLLRIGADNRLEPGVATSYDLSADGCTYTFHLRECRWSNGDPVTAYDFVYSWKSLLRPDFPAPNCYQLFVIKNGKAAKQGEKSLDDIAISAPDPHTLVVTLERPIAYFPELTAFHALLPVHKTTVETEADWAAGSREHWVGNGPYTLDHWTPHYELHMIQNPHYWDRNAFVLNSVTVVPVDEHTALSLFQRGELDWIGSPLSNLPPDALATLHASKQLEVKPAAATHFLRLNATRSYLQDARVRKALALAINRKDLVEHIMQGGQPVATALVPHSPSYFMDHDVVMAKRLLREALRDSCLPPLVFTYGWSERNHKLAQALQQQWRETLGIDVQLEALEAKTCYDRFANGQYDIGNGSWFADFLDPISFLQIFQQRNNGTNNTGWEDETYKRLLEEAHGESNLTKRQELLKQAEMLLMEEMPVIPLFFYTLTYQKHPRITNVSLSELGILNLRSSSL